MDLIVEYIGNLPRKEYICNPEGTLLDIRFEIRAKEYVCTRSLTGLDWTDATKYLVGYLGTLPRLSWTNYMLGKFAGNHFWVASLHQVAY